MCPNTWNPRNIPAQIFLVLQYLVVSCHVCKFLHVGQIITLWRMPGNILHASSQDGTNLPWCKQGMFNLVSQIKPDITFCTIYHIILGVKL